MSVDGLLDNAFTLLLAKAQRPAQDPTRRTATINFEWGGAGVPVAVATADPLLVEVPFDATLVWAHLYAGDGQGHPLAVSATVDVELTQLLTFGSSRPLSGTGTVPTLSGQAAADLSLTGWLPNLVTGDTLIANLSSFSGTASWVALILQIQSSDVPQGVGTIVDSAGATVVDSNGNTLALRS